MSVNKSTLRRYTDLPALIHLLKIQKITFLDPSKWDDRNDRLFMQLYKESCKLRSLLALCFSQENETYHHWRVFANGPSGVCISFKRAELVAAVKKQSGVRVGEVSYLRLNRLKRINHEINDLPFLKRHPYGPECEVRFIYESKRVKREFLDVAIPLDCIQQVYLSPWMPKVIADSVQEVLNEIPLFGFRITRSTLIQNDMWADYGHRIVDEAITRP
jgi:hypothetical protein